VINFTTQTEYQGSNVVELLAEGFPMGSEFCTFKQAVQYYNLTGKELAGAKSCATLRKLVTKDEIKDGKKIKKQVMRAFRVFEKSHLLETMANNGHTPLKNNAEVEAYDIGSYYCNKFLGKGGV